MSTTRPITGREPSKDVGAKRVSSSKAGRSESVERTSGSEARETTPTKVADSVQSTSNLVEVAKQEFNRADEQLLEDLKQAVKEGRFKVDPDRLAARLVEDAFHDLDKVR